MGISITVNSGNVADSIDIASVNVLAVLLSSFPLLTIVAVLMSAFILLVLLLVLLYLHFYYYQ